ncbi:MAG: T9SS type A sorting domain-containing protein, partial [Saprospiraceae bacterium]
ADSTILILLNKGDGSFESYPQDSEVAYGFRTSDMDGDQDIDIVAFNEIEHTVFLMMNDGNGEFESKNLLTNEDDLYTVELGDLDLDEDMDIIIGYNGFFEGKIIELENKGSNVFLERNIKEHAINDLENIQIIDIDRDGDYDIAYSSLSSTTLLAMINNGNNTYTNADLVQGLGSISSFKIADYNTDGIMDIMLGCYSADNTYHQGLSANSFEYDSEVVTGIQPMYFIANGDFDSDHDLDAILSNGDFWWISNELEQSHVGIPEVADVSYSIFPNPFSNSLELHVDFEKVDIYISDQLGKMLMRTTNTLPLNLEFLKEGLYFLSIVDRKSGKFVQTSKIIKTK